jgi:ATP-dependent RNA helicase DeaD
MLNENVGEILDQDQTPSEESVAAPVSQATEVDAPVVPEVLLDSEVALIAEVSQEEEPCETGFSKLGLPTALVDAASKAGYLDPTPIQEQTIPLLLAGKDVLGQAQTGTGKTAAFALPTLAKIDAKQNRPQVLVLAPTRELAIQVSESYEKYGKYLRGLKVATVYGGQDYQVQFRQLKQGPQIIVGTPGRVMDHMRRGTLELDALRCVVLDEADEMLRMGFADDVEWVLSQAPAKRQMALFSATMPGPIREIAQRHLHRPAEVTIAQKTATADTIDQRYVIALPHQKQAVLARILEAEEIDGVLIFVKTRSTTEPLAEYLSKTGLRAAALNGEMAQKQRERIVDGLREGRIDIIVATDVAARGLDVQRISHVVNYDLPHDSEAYVHRIGRTGRAGRTGKAILFVHPKDRRALQRLEHATRQPIEPMDPPSNRMINKNRVARFHDRITENLAHAELEKFQAIIEHYQRDNQVSLEMIAASLAIMANGGTPLLVKEEFKKAEFAADMRHERKEGRHNAPRRSNESMESFRIEVGRRHRVQPGNIVGVIARVTGIDGAMIGRIKIHDKYSIVDLPKELGRDALQALSDAAIAGRPLRMSPIDVRSIRAQTKRPPFAKTTAKKRPNRAKSGERSAGPTLSH